MVANAQGHKLIVIDLGKKSRKKIKALKKSEGELVEEVATTLRQQIGPAIDAGDTIPVFLLFEEKKKKSKTLKSPFVSPLLKY